MIILKNDTQWYSYHYINSTGHTPRLVMEITVEKEDIITDWQKRKESLLDSDGKPKGQSQQSKILNKMFDELFPVNKVVEEQLRHERSIAYEFLKLAEMELMVNEDNIELQKKVLEPV